MANGGPHTGQRDKEAKPMRPIEFAHGYAGDVAVSAGTVWVAWATCETDELSLFS